MEQLQRDKAVRVAHNQTRVSSMCLLHSFLHFLGIAGGAASCKGTESCESCTSKTKISSKCFLHRFLSVLGIAGGAAAEGQSRASHAHQKRKYPASAFYTDFCLFLELQVEQLQRDRAVLVAHSNKEIQRTEEVCLCVGCVFEAAWCFGTWCFL